MTECEKTRRTKKKGAHEVALAPSLFLIARLVHRCAVIVVLILSWIYRILLQIALMDKLLWCHPTHRIPPWSYNDVKRSRALRPMKNTSPRQTWRPYRLAWHLCFKMQWRR
eukprot:1021552-Amphidinium_carterae.1